MFLLAGNKKHLLQTNTMTFLVHVFLQKQQIQFISTLSCILRKTKSVHLWPPKQFPPQTSRHAKRYQQKKRDTPQKNTAFPTDSPQKDRHFYSPVQTKREHLRSLWELLFVVSQGNFTDGNNHRNLRPIPGKMNAGFHEAFEKMLNFSGYSSWTKKYGECY